jgi:hypothetical protein
MQQSVGFSMVLRLYVVLMLVAPAYVWLAAKRFWYPMAAAGVIWAASGHFGLVDHDRLTGELLSMNILTWQLVFASGISLGAAIVQGVPLPRSRIFAAAALLLVVVGTLLLVTGSRISPSLGVWLETRNDFFWTGISKSYQSPLRLFYLLGLVYLVAAFPKAPVVRLLHQARPTSLLCRLGRHSLPVFAFSAVFALAIDHLLWNLISADLVTQRGPAALLIEVALVACGLWLMVLITGSGGRAAGLWKPAMLVERFRHARRRLVTAAGSRRAEAR